MKMKIVVALMIVLMIAVGGYRLTAHLGRGDSGTAEVVTPVKVVEISMTGIEDTLDYEGRVMPLSLEKVSFKSTARLESFGGEIGETLMKGDVLAALDTGDLELAVEAAHNQLNAAVADYERASKGSRYEDVSLAKISVEKADNAVSYLTKRYEDVQALFAEGVVSQSELDGLKLELDLAGNDYDLAKKTYEKAVNGAEPEIVKAAEAHVALAETNLAVQQTMLEDAVYTLGESKVIVDRLYEPGELVPAGYPVAIVRSIEQSVTIGVSRKDLDKIYIGQPVHVVLKDDNTDGEVIRIAQVPDSSHYLYEVEISLPGEDYVVGEIASCELIMGQRDVVTIPVKAIMNDGIDYVYVASEAKVTVRQITIEGVTDGYAIVKGLEPGERMIINNLNRISENSLIQIEE